MEDFHLGPVEARFANLIWSHEPIPSSQLVKLCQQELSWKKSTTYTVLRRLCQRGIFQNTDSVVTSCISQEEFAAKQSRQFVKDAFSDSLPKFLAAFSSQKKLTQEELRQLQQMIDQMR